MSSMQYKFNRSVGREAMLGRWWNRQLKGECVHQVSLEMLAGAAVWVEEDEEILIKYK